MDKKEIKIFIVLIIAMISVKFGMLFLPGIISDVASIIYTIVIIPTIVYIAGKFIRNNENNKVYERFFLLFAIINFVFILLEDKVYIRNIFEKILNNNIFYLLFIVSAYSIILKLFRDKKNSFVYAICTSLLMSMQNIPNIIGALFYYLPFAVLGYNDSLKIENEKLDIKKLIFSIISIIITKYYLDYRALTNYFCNSVNECNDLRMAVGKVLMYLSASYIIKFIYHITKESNVKIGINKNFGKLLFTISLIDFIIQTISLNFNGIVTFGFRSKLLYTICSAIYIIIALIFLMNGKKEKSKNNKLVEKNKKYSANIILSIAFVCLIFFKQFIFAKMLFNFKLYDDFYNCFLYVALIVLVLAPMILFNKVNKKYNYLLYANIILSVITIANLWYYKYQSNFIALSQIQNGRYVKEIVSALFELVELKDFILVLDIPFIIILKKYILKMFKEENNTLFYRMLLFITVYTVTLSCRVQVYSALDDGKYQSLGVKTKFSSLIGYYVNDVMNVLNRNFKYQNSEEFMSEYNKYKETKVNTKQVYGVAKDKNVIIVQLESVQNFMINSKINGNEITPNINKFLEKNTNITNMHSQSYTTTADSEFTFATGIMPLENGQSFVNNYNKEYKDIYSILKNNGYYTSFAHGNIEGFWNRKKVYEAFGVDNTMYINDFENTKGFRVSGYLSDEEVYEQTIECMKKYPKKYLQVISTASSHLPFKLEGMPDDYRKQVISIDVGKYKNTMFGNYLEACNYADYAFGKFIEKLKAEGMYEDSVIMIFGDHAGLPLENEELATYFKEEKNIEMNTIIDKYNFTNVLAGIRVPNLDSDEITYPTSKLDVKSTILDLLGIEDEFSLGFSVFTPKNYVSTTNHLIVTDKYFYEDKWYDLKTGEPIDLEILTKEENELLEKYKKEMMFKIDVSNSIGYNNVLKSN